MPSRRPATALTALAALAILTGCTSAPSDTGSTPVDTTSSGASASAGASPSATPLTSPSPGSASAAVKVEGASGSAPTISFPTPTTVTTIQRTIVTKGTGPAVQPDDSVRIAYTLFDGRTGKKLDSRGYGSTDPITLTVDKGQTLSGIVDALADSHVGDRFAAVIPASSAFGSQGSEQLGVAGGDSIVFVADVVGIVPEKADGTAKTLPSGFPTVTLAADGQPTVKVPNTSAPTTLKIADSKVGDGATVREGDSVTVQYQGLLWKSGTVFDQSWGKTGPTALTAKSGQVIPGFATALIGQKVGSQVVAIIPPAEGYGKNPPSGSGISATDTLVFVIDILATSHSS